MAGDSFSFMWRKNLQCWVNRFCIGRNKEKGMSKGTELLQNNYLLRNDSSCVCFSALMRKRENSVGLVKVIFAEEGKKIIGLVPYWQELKSGI